jgi:hypothetical protein
MFEVLDPATARDLDPAALVATIESGHREESVLVARRMAAVAALLRHRVAAAERAEQQRGYAVIDGFEQTAAEVAAAMNLSPAGASYLVSYAEALDNRLPHVAALLGEGRTDWRTVRLIISRTDLVADDDLIAKLDQSLAARSGAWHGWSRQRIVNAVDAAVRAADPDAARERREAAEDDRRIAITALGNGMAEVYGNVAAATATAFDRRLSQLAKQVCPADPRTLDQRRADALAALPRRPTCAPPDANRRSREKQRSARIAQARKHNREQRPVNEARRWLEQARNQEITARKFRNHMRGMLFPFKGTSSTSPFCTWVNDPREPEELPADWRPDKPAAAALPDDPPF